MRRTPQILALGLALLHLPAIAASAERPKLVVVVSVDQMCQDYLIRFRENFSPQGAFRRVWGEGAHYAQCHHRHAYTVTAPGHSVQLTGTYPASTGIIGNNWFDRAAGKDIYCVADPAVQVIGTISNKGMSPKNLLVETVGDVLRLKSSGKSKVFGVAIKDRASILMTGQNPSGAYWLENNVWVTSSYYRPDLPGYLRVLNEQRAIERFRGQVWSLLLPAEKYVNRGPDKNAWENPPKGFTSEFPHQLFKVGEGTAELFGDHVLFSPFGNDLTLEAAREIVTHEKLGQDEHPDLLCINFSSNDYVGHAFGPHSLEVEDITYRTDLQLAEFLTWLDGAVGQGNWTFALTADHGVAPIVEYAQQYRLPAHRNPLGKLDEAKLKLEQHLRGQLGVAAAENKPLVLEFDENQIFFQPGHAALDGARFGQAQQIARDWLLTQPFVAIAATRDDLLRGGEGELNTAMRRTFHPRRSGEVLYFLAPYCVPGTKGTTHGSPWHYDTHVPLLLLGSGIRPGKYPRPVSQACLASTVAELVGVNYPSANVEGPLSEALAP
ncbi:MAG: alkaline phosphatase family protein [Pirellulaceae bacterium]|nr:alkaline phosphatase family protein [Pirellulaceae bacterium]